MLDPRHRPGIAHPHGRAQYRDRRPAYPSTFHALAAVFSQVSGSRQPWRTPSAHSWRPSGCSPSSAAVLAWLMLRRSTTQWRTAICAAAAAALAAEHRDCPTSSFDTASMPIWRPAGWRCRRSVTILGAAPPGRIPLAVVAVVGVLMPAWAQLLVLLSRVGVWLIRRFWRQVRGRVELITLLTVDYHQRSAAAAPVHRGVAAGRDHRQARLQSPMRQARADRRDGQHAISTTSRSSGS